MNISTETVGEQVLAISLEGRLNSSNSDSALNEIMGHLQESPSRVLIRLEPLEFLSSAGLRVLLRLAKHVRRYSGALKLSGPHGTVKGVLEISGFDSLLDVYATDQLALDSFD